MKPLVVIIGVLGVGGLGLALLAGREYGPTPTSKPAPEFDTPPHNTFDMKARQTILMRAKPDADWAADGYSRHKYYVVNQPHTGQWSYSGKESETLAAAQAAGLPIDHSGPMRAIDEFGRPWHGVSGDPLGTMLTAAGYALPFVPGVGPAAAAALATTIALAKGKSLKDAALAGIRGALPGPAQVAFDVGIAVASGESVDEASKKALLNTIPGGYDAYQQGVKAWETVKG